MNHQKTTSKKSVVVHALALPKGVKVIKGRQNARLRKWINDRDITTSGGCHTVHRQYA